MTVTVTVTVTVCRRYTLLNLRERQTAKRLAKSSEGARQTNPPFIPDQSADATCIFPTNLCFYGRHAYTPDQSLNATCIFLTHL